jgi:hypothetical protein
MQLRSLSLALALTACAVTAAPNDDHFPNAAYTQFIAGVEPLAFELRTSPSQPPERGSFAMEVRVADRSGVPRDGLDIDVVPFMGAHGHGTNANPTITPIGDGRYRIDGLELSMPGFWQLQFVVRGEGIDANATTTLEVR